MATPGKDPVYVNSNKAAFSGTSFSKIMIQDLRKACAAVVMKEADYDLISINAQKPPKDKWDLKENVFIGTATLIDYNYVLMCNHTFKSIVMGAGNKMMKANKVSLFFYNEFTKASADTNNPQAEPSCPQAFIRGDLEAWVGTNDDVGNEDFAIVKIEWNGSDFGRLGKIPKLPDPATFNSSSLLNQKVCTLQQYSNKKIIKTDIKTHFSLQVAMGPVTVVNFTAQIKIMSCYSCVNHLSTDGSSGSGIYDGNDTLVGILCGGIFAGTYSLQTFFLPLDKIYSCQNVSYGKTSGQKLKDIYNYRKTNEKW